VSDADLLTGKFLPDLQPPDRGGIYYRNFSEAFWRNELKELGMDTSEFVVEARIAKRWCAIAGSEYELAARRLFERASYKCPADTILRLRRGPQVLIKMPANGLERVRE
jgi:hypothetical protein